MPLLEWIRQAAELKIEAVEMYDAFFLSRDDTELEEVLGAMKKAGLRTSMLCFSPDFTHPDAARRDFEIQRQKSAVDLALKLGTPYCRTLSGQRHPETAV